MNENELRPLCQIQMAHDILIAVVLKEVPVTVPDEDFPSVVSALDVLCWVLQHENNQTFQSNLSQIVEEIAALGFVLTPRERKTEK